MMSCCVVYDVLLHRYLETPQEYLHLFEDDNAFFEIFCMCFLHVDSVWVNRKAVRTDFGKIIGEEVMCKNVSIFLRFIR